MVGDCISFDHLVQGMVSQMQYCYRFDAQQLPNQSAKKKQTIAQLCDESPVELVGASAE